MHACTASSRLGLTLYLKGGEQILVSVYMGNGVRRFFTMYAGALEL